jgi:hypothetical protein
MAAFHPGLPLPGEFKPAFAGYIDKARAFSDPVAKLTAQLREVQDLLRPLDAAKQSYRYAPGKWTVKDVLGHIIDAERVFAYRALRIGRGDRTPLASFDENGFAAAAHAESAGWDHLLEEFEHVRRATILLLERLPPDAWTRTGIAGDAALSVRALAYITIGHVTHHLDILRERYLQIPQKGH